MRITLIQSDIEWANPASNAEKFRQAIEATPGADLYLLPEMWSTGFATRPEGIAEEESGTGLKWMKHTADATGAAVAGSIAIHTGGTYRNRFYFVKPGGDVTYYDKHHLFTYGGEHLHYTAGDRRVIVEWKGVRFLLIICYDLRFPLWARSREDYDAILCVASWPRPRIEAWRALLKARAIENQCYLAAVNRIGTDPSCEYCGGTSFIDPYGAVTECRENLVETLTRDIDLTLLEEFRQKFPVLKDRD